MSDREASEQQNQLVLEASYARLSKENKQLNKSLNLHKQLVESIKRKWYLGDLDENDFDLNKENKNDN